MALARSEVGILEGSQLMVAPSAQYDKLSVIIPVYNERNTVVEVLRRIRALDLPIHLEVVVIDDGSTDGTDKVLRAVEDSTVRVLTHPNNQGKSAAVRTGLDAVTGDLILIQDADLEYDPDDWPRMLEPLLKGKAQVVFGSRFTGERKNMALSDWIANRFLVFTTNVIYRTTLSDMETCLKLFDREVLEGVTIESDGFDFEPEFTAKVLNRGLRIYEVPISWAGRETSEGRKYRWQDSVRALRALLRYRDH
jgi:glycosyltransferase involved in cell wall biosynthesis